MITISEIVKNCGGRQVIADNARKLTYDAVRKWEKFGIPEKHWAIVMRLHKGRLSEKMLHALNESFRKEEVDA